ncbi:MAG: hypothetical protein AB7E32_02140 [Desulfovibrio sp.]
MLKRKVIVVAERIKSHDPSHAEEWTLEYLEDSYYNELICGLKQGGFFIEHFESPRELVERLRVDGEVVVLPLWSGKESRNRRALVPAICESFGVKFVGADVYTAMVCQDKVLAKTFCSRAGLATPRHVLVPEHREPADFSPVRFPCVVKPSLEGGSMGITDDCIVSNKNEALEKANLLRSIWKQPILVEEFVAGREISICVAGNDTVQITGAAEVIVAGSPEYFNNNVNSVDLKKYMKIDRVNVKCAAEEIAPFTDSCIELFRSLKKVDFIRIDGKLSTEGFIVLELTPDAHMGSTSSLAVSLTSDRRSYPELLRFIIDAAT